MANISLNHVTISENQALRTKIMDIDLLSQEGFSQISSTANLALFYLKDYKKINIHLDDILQAFYIIREKANDIKNIINSEAEILGCAYTPPYTSNPSYNDLIKINDWQVGWFYGEV